MLIAAILTLAAGTYSMRLGGVLLRDRLELNASLQRLLPMAATALLAADVSPVAASASTSGPLEIGPASALPPSCLMRRSTSRAWPLVSFRCSCRRFL